MSEFPSESALISAAIAGDATAVEQLLWSYYSPLERYVEPRIPKRADRHFDVEDILQIVFAEVYRNIGRFEPRGDGSFFAYLRTVADHRVIDAIRRIDREDAREISPGQRDNASSLGDLIDAVCGKSSSPSVHARKHEAIRAIQIALASLAEDQQEAIRLLWLEHKSVEEIACATGRTEAAVRGLIYRGEKKLAAAMGRSSRWLSSG